MFHVTLTRAWLVLMEAALRRTAASTFDEFAAAHPDLLDKDRIYRHYRRETIAGPQARAGWVAPDLQPLE